MSFGSRFKAAREKMGLSQQKIADKLNVTDGTISNYEKGVAYPRWDTINKICDILNVDPNYLFWDDISEDLKIKLSNKDILCNSEIKALTNHYNNLNERGQKMLKEYIRLLSEDKKYSKQAIFLHNTQENREMVAYGLDEMKKEEWHPKKPENTAFD